MLTRALVLPSPCAAPRLEEIEVREPGPGEVLVRMEACGLCHSDLFVSGLKRLPLTPLVLGHEGIGRIAALGPAVTGFQEGDRAGITFLASSCSACALCAAGAARFCARQTNSGYSAQGVMAEWAVVPAQHLTPVPENLPAVEAAPLCCAGWTAYGALREAGLKNGQTVGLFGMGGLGHLAVQYARERGLRAAASDVSQEKLDHALELGAEFAVAAEDAGRTLQKMTGGVDAAIVLTAAPAAIQQAFRSLKRGGTLVLVGLASQPFELPVVDAVLKGITVKGSFLGTAADLEEVFALAGRVRPWAEAHPLDAAPALLERLHRGEIRGRAVISFR